MHSTGRSEAPGDSAVIVARRFEASDDGAVKGLQELDEPVVLHPCVRNNEAAATRLAGTLDQNIVAALSDIDGDENGAIWDRMCDGHGRLLSPKCGVDTVTLEIFSPPWPPSGPCYAQVPEPAS